MKYIDFDGVILNTIEVMIKEYYKDKVIPEKIYIDDDFMINYDWHKLLSECHVINDAIEIIKSFDPAEITILSKILSLDNEGIAKINYLRSMGIKCNIVLVPKHTKKTDVVYAENSILIDDSLNNLEDWQSHGGIPIFFDVSNNNTDAFGIKNTKFEKTNTLEILNKY